MSSKRERIIMVLHTLLDGATSASDRVYRGKTRFDDKDILPCISIISGASEIASETGLRTQLDWPINIQAIVAADMDHPSDTTEPLLAEIKTAVFAAGNENLNGECMNVSYLGDGGDENDEDIYISASVRINVRYLEHVGDPTK